MNSISQSEKENFVKDKTKFFYNGKSLESMTEKEVQELQLFYLKNLSENINRINKNIVFFFWFFIATLIIALYNLYQIQSQVLPTSF